MLALLAFACAPSPAPASDPPDRVAQPEASAQARGERTPPVEAEPPPRLDALTRRAQGHSPVEGCPARVEDLPHSDLFDPADPRLQSESLIVVLKQQRRLVLFSGGVRAEAPGHTPACWWVGLASGYVEGHKQRRGDLRTPEGWQRTSDRPWSNYYQGISVHYPSAADAERGLTAGLIDAGERDAIVDAHARGQLPPMKTRLGGQIVIHGGGGRADWTLGCVGMDDADIDALRTGLPEDVRADLLVLP